MQVLAVDKTTYRVSDFLSWQRAGTLRLSPSFQRRPVWKPAAKSYLIDTIVRGLPVPIIFLRERVDLQSLEPMREVVDGQQRLRTLISFIEPTVLPDFHEDRDAFLVQRNHNEEIADKSFPELTDAVRSQILNYSFSVHVLPPDTDDRDVLKIFARLNSTGVKLNAQELRNADWFGYYKIAAYDLAYEQLPRWRSWHIFTEDDIARMSEVELVSELFQLMFEGVVGKRQKDIDKIYEMKDLSFPEEAEARKRFEEVMDAIDDTCGTQMPSLVFSRVALFHTLFTFVYDLMFGLGSPLTRMDAKRLPKNLSRGLAKASREIDKGHVSEALAKALRGATSHKVTRMARLTFVRSVALDGAS